MENVHVPILKEVLALHFPTTYILRYVERAGSGIGDRLGATVGSQKTDPDAPVLLVGSLSEHDWDLTAEMVFKDMLHLQQALAVMNSPEAQKIKDDEELFTQADKLRVVVMGEATIL